LQWAAQKEQQADVGKGNSKVISTAETIVSRSLRIVLAGMSPGSAIDESEPFRELQSALERFIPSVLGLRYEGLDAFRFAVARKVGPEEAEFIGLCLLITDQTWTPFHIRLRVSSTVDKVAALDCKLGEVGEGAGGIVRTPYDSNRVAKLLLSLPGRIHSIQWAHAVSR
jgi:hypothetical protein